MMRTMLVVSTLLVVLSVAFVSQWMASKNKAAARRESEVRLPVSDLDSYIGSMMRSSHEVVFLNLRSIGENENYVVLEPIGDGVTIRFPAFTTSAWARRQGQYADRLRDAAKSLTLELEETSEIADDGAIEGVNFQIRVTGEPEKVAQAVEKVITRTFDIDSAEECEFQYHNMPSIFSRRPGEEPRTVDSDEFVDKLLSGERVYLGESRNLIYAISPAHIEDESPYWNSTIWRTDVRQIPSDVLERIRQIQGD